MKFYLLILAFFSAITCAQSLKPGIYKYDIKWENIKAAEAILTVSVSHDGFRLQIKANTAGWLKPFYRLDYTADVLLLGSFKRVHGVALKKDNNEEEHIAYKRKDEVLIIERKFKKKKKDKAGKITRELVDAWDPFSAAVASLLAPWDTGLSYTYYVSNGKTEYTIILECVEVKRLSDGSSSIRIKPTVKSLNEKQIKKLKSVEVVVNDKGGVRTVSRIKSKVFIGNVYFDLRSKSPGELVFAQFNLD
ncbi:MAG: DUF3108 domain-containing protein [Deltaproteobacteria bacterium]|nr:DUF3108 domain-containing protein [Deltaproteobacteria bacterium]